MAESPLRLSGRTRRFLWLFAGIVRDFRREAKLVHRVGMKSARARMSKRHRKRAIQFRETALDMGGVLIKLGQFMSTRADVMPEEYLEELRRLQDEVSPVPFVAIRGQIEREFGAPVDAVFHSVDPDPLGAASLAQVHRAVLKDGRHVVLKVQRPDIERLVDTDLSTFAWVMGGVERFTKFGRRNDIRGLVNEFSRTLGEELDFFREAHNAERFRENFTHDPTVAVPHIYWEYVTRRIITLEGIEGIKINDFPALAAAGYDRGQLAQLVTDAYLEQVLDHGFFHADPHPGNIFVLPGPVLCFIDFGMVGEIDAEAREEIKGLALGVARKDADEVVRVLSRLGFLRKGANVTAPRNALAFLFEQYGSLTRADVTVDALETIQEDLRVMVYEQPFTLPAQFAFLARAIGTMVGLATTLDPEFDLADAAAPKLKKLIDEAKAGWLDIVQKEASQIGSALLRMPRAVDELLLKAQRGDLKVRVDAREIAAAVSASERMRGRQSVAIWGVGALAGSIALTITGFPQHATALGLVSGVLFIATIMPRRRSRII